MIIIYNVKNNQCYWRPIYKRPIASQDRAEIDDNGNVRLKYIWISKYYNDAMGGSDSAQ